VKSTITYGNLLKNYRSFKEALHLFLATTLISIKLTDYKAVM